MREKTPMESAEIKATRSPVEKAGTLCPDSTRCTSQYLHCTGETAQVSHQWSLVDNAKPTLWNTKLHDKSTVTRPEPSTEVELGYSCSMMWVETFLAFYGMAVKKLAVIIAMFSCIKKLLFDSFSEVYHRFHSFSKV